MAKEKKKMGKKREVYVALEAKKNHAIYLMLMHAWIPSACN